MLRIDWERRILRVSVRAVAQWPPDPPRPAGWLPQARLELGNEAHRRYRRERAAEVDGFQAEVPVALTHTVGGFEVRLQGRVDGWIEQGPGALRIEELKSTHAPRPEHRLQLRLYGLCAARARPGRAVQLRLMLACPIEGTRRGFEIDFDPALTERTLETRARSMLAHLEKQAERSRRRARLASRLHFPYERPRPQQTELMAAVERGLEAGRPILAMAPTGVGKTVAALLPALRHALARDRTLFFGTAKTTQQRLVAETFVDLARATGEGDGVLHAVSLSAKAHLCPPGHQLCHVDHCGLLARFLQDREARAAALDALLEGRTHVGPGDLLRAGGRAGLCPYALGLALCREVDLVIGDHNYVHGATAALSMFEDESEARRAVVVLDEAHNLFDRVREQLSPFVSVDLVAQTERQVRAQGFPEEVAAYFAGLHALLRDELDRAAAPGRDGCAPWEEADPRWDDLAAGTPRIALRCVLHLEASGEARAHDPLFEVLRSVRALRESLRCEEPEFVAYLRPRAPAGAGVLCVNPARRLEQRHRLLGGTVAMSATLLPLNHYREVLGLGNLDPVEVRLGSPFPAARRRVLVVPTVSTAYRDRERHHQRVADTVRGVAGARPGHYVAYFPSFSYLERVRPLLDDLGTRLLVQERSMPPAARARLLARLRDDPDPLLLLAVTGGIFAEGVDLPGEALVGAILVGPALPQVGFERDRMREYFGRHGGRGFLRAMLYPGMQRVIQSAGRVHRTESDRGVIVLLDRRFAQRPYTDCFPPHWYDERPGELVTEDPVAALRAFWDRATAPVDGP